jgi:hypothetical protein
MCPDEQRRTLPPEELRAWEAFWDTHKHMFSSLGFSDAYDEDYSFLSSIAHGRPPTLVSDYGEAPVIPVRPDRHVSMLLVYGMRYFLGIVHRWNEVFELIAWTLFTLSPVKLPLFQREVEYPRSAA